MWCLTKLALILSSSLISFGVRGPAFAQSSLLGPGAGKSICSWRLVEATSEGKIRPEREEKSPDLITYHGNGWMTARIQQDHPSIGRVGATPSGEEAKAASMATRLMSAPLLFMNRPGLSPTIA